MADPSPFLPRTGTAEQPWTETKRRHPSLDSTIEHCVGDFGWKYILQATLVCFAMFFDSQQTFISVFTDAEPKWSCTNTATCNTNSDPCHLPGDSWRWDSPANASVISEWSLQCGGSIVKGLPASSFFFGCFLGGFALATLADSEMGRKKSLVLSSLLMSLTGVVTAFSTNIWIYTALRFVSGFGRATIGTSSLVLSTELVGKKWREHIGILGFIFFTMGFLSLPIIAFLLEGSSWRIMYLWTSVPAVMYSILVLSLVSESPRWLFIKGRKEEFAETLRSFAAPTNRSSLTQSFFGRCFPWEDQKAEESSIFSAGKILLENDWSRRRLLAAMVYGFGIGMIYYGMPLGLGNLSFDLYQSVMMNALSEFPASLFTFVLLGKMGRRGLILGLSLLSGVCSVSCVLVESKGRVQMGLELVSFCSACTTFDVSLIYTLELFPTCVRNSAVSMVRQAMVFSGALAPVLIAAGRKNGWASFGVFGVVIAVCGMSVVFLPETKGRVLCDTMEDEERWSDGAWNGNLK